MHSSLEIAMALCTLVALTCIVGAPVTCICALTLSIVYSVQSTAAERIALFRRWQQTLDALASTEASKQCHFLNVALAKMWRTTLVSVTGNFLHNTLQEQLALLPYSIRVGDFSLGSRAPILSNICIVEPNDPNRANPSDPNPDNSPNPDDYVDVEFDVTFASDEAHVNCYAQAKGISLHLLVDRLLLVGRVRVSIEMGDGELRLVHVSFVSVPTLDFAVSETNIGVDVSALPVIRSVLMSTVRQRLADALVWPRGIAMPMLNGAAVTPAEFAAWERRRAPYVDDVALVFPAQSPTAPRGYRVVADSSQQWHPANLLAGRARASAAQHGGSAWLFVRRGSTASRAITDVALVPLSARLKLPPEWHVARRTAAGHRANLYANMHVAYRRGTQSAALVDIGFVYGAYRQQKAEPLPVQADVLPYEWSEPNARATDRRVGRSGSDGRGDDDDDAAQPPPDYVRMFVRRAQQRNASTMSSVSAPIADICVVFVDRGEVPPDGYTLLSLATVPGTATLGEQLADLNSATGGRSIFLAYRRDDAAKPIVDIALSRPDRGERPPRGHHSVLRTVGGRDASLNSGSDGDQIYLSFARADAQQHQGDANSSSVIDDLAVIMLDTIDATAGDPQDFAPPGYELLRTDVNRRSGGLFVYVCFKRVQQLRSARAAIKSRVSSQPSVPVSSSLLLSSSSSLSLRKMLSSSSSSSLSSSRKSRVREAEHRSVGVTPEMLEFVEHICNNDDLFLKFPLDDMVTPFQLTPVQERHACFMLERSPKLSQIRYSLCPRRISDEVFWFVYFRLVHNQLERAGILTNLDVDDDWVELEN
jgi:BSD domain